MASNNPLGIRKDIKPANEGGRRVVAKAKSYVGTVESPALSNTGTKVNEWNAYFGQTAISWGGSFATACYWESKVWDQGIGDPIPLIMYQRAKALDRVGPIAFPGSFVIYGTWDSTYKNMTAASGVDIFVRWHDVENRIAVVIGGDLPIGSPVTNNGVLIQYRSMIVPKSTDLSTRAIFVTPKAISLRESKIVNITV